MRTRTTKAELEQLVTVLNNRLGRPQYGWYRFAGKNVARVGALTLDGPYNGWRLQEVMNAGGGEYELSPRLPAGQMLDYLRGMDRALDLVEAAGPIPSWVPDRMKEVRG